MADKGKEVHQTTVDGNVETGGGDFVGRDKVTITQVGKALRDEQYEIVHLVGTLLRL